MTEDLKPTLVSAPNGGCGCGPSCPCGDACQCGADKRCSETCPCAA